jgi:hypothetical protein
MALQGLSCFEAMQGINFQKPKVKLKETLPELGLKMETILKLAWVELYFLRFALQLSALQLSQRISLLLCRRRD